MGAVTVGRAADLATVDRLIADVRKGHKRTMLITGEAGIGKSRMLAETAQRAHDKGLTVLRGHAVEGGGTYRPIAEALVGHLRSKELPDNPELRPYLPALSRLAPDIDAVPEPGVDPAVVLGEAVLRLLSALKAALLLEDLHWADPDTLAVLDYVSAADADRPVLIAATARDDVRLRRATHIRLDRLDDNAVREMAAALGAKQRRQNPHRPRGRPAVPGRGTAGERPGRAAHVRRARRRPPPLAQPRGPALRPRGRHRRPGPAPPTSGGRARGRRRPPAPRRKVDDNALTWRHALTREAVLARLLPPERVELARRLATHLDEDRAAEVLATAGEHEAAAGILVRLARRDLDRGALKSAGDRLDRARSDSPEWTIERIRLATLTGDVPAALDAGAAIIDRLTGDAHAELCLQLARSAIVGSRWDEAERYAERAGRPDDPRTGIIRADAAYGAGDMTRAAVAAKDAVANAGPTDKPAALLVYGRVLAHDDPDAALAAFRQAAQVAAEHGMTPSRVAALIGEATVLANDEPVPAVLATARALAEPAGLLGQVTSIDLLTADLENTANGPAAGEPIARRAAEQAARLRLSPSEAVAALLVAGCRAGVGDIAGIGNVAAKGRLAGQCPGRGDRRNPHRASHRRAGRR